MLVRLPLRQNSSNEKLQVKIAVYTKWARILSKWGAKKRSFGLNAPQMEHRALHQIVYDWHIHLEYHPTAKLQEEIQLIGYHARNPITTRPWSSKPSLHRKRRKKKWISLQGLFAGAQSGLRLRGLRKNKPKGFPRRRPLCYHISY